MKASLGSCSTGLDDMVGALIRDSGGDFAAAAAVANALALAALDQRSPMCTVLQDTVSAYPGVAVTSVSTNSVCVR